MAAIATVATLVYLAIQIRQNTDSVQTSSELSLSHQMSDWAKEAINNPNIAKIWDTAASEPLSLDDDERILYLWFVFQLFLIVEGHYQLYAKKRISERAWMAKAGAALGLINNPLVAAWWDLKIAPFNPAFVDHINTLRSTTGHDWEYRNIRELIREHT
ncbi:MAG: hypothetical protein RIC85_00875 [Gammaproteobacteria bacterium]